MQIDKVSINTNYYILDTIITIIISKEEINKSNATREGNFREGKECRLFSRVSRQVKSWDANCLKCGSNVMNKFSSLPSLHSEPRYESNPGSFGLWNYFLTDRVLATVTTILDKYSRHFSNDFEINCERWSRSVKEGSCYRSGKISIASPWGSPVSLLGSEIKRKCLNHLWWEEPSWNERNEWIFFSRFKKKTLNLRSCLIL